MVELGMSLIFLAAFSGISAAVFGLVTGRVNYFIIGTLADLFALIGAVNGGEANQFIFYKLLATWGVASTMPTMLILVFAALRWEHVRALLK